VGVSASATGAVVGVETVRENLPAVLRLVAEVLKEPALEERELELLREEWLAGLEEERNEPGSQAQRAWDMAVTAYPKHHPYAPLTLEEELAETRSTTLEQVRAFHREFFGASQGELAVVGDFDPAQVEALVGELFGGWKSLAAYERVVRRPCRSEPVPQVLQVADKASAIFMAGQCMTLKDSDADWPALLLGNYLLGGYTNSRLWQRVREREGLSYGVSSGMSAGKLDAVGGFMVTATAAPQNVEKLEAAVREELRLVLEKGFSTEELEKARSGLLEQWRTSRTSESALAANLADYLFYGRTLEYEARLEQTLKALTPEQVRATLVRYLDTTRLKVVKAGDFVGKR
jgi:zinc protease